jgi:hypothetical protein
MKRTFLQFSAAVLVAVCLFACQKDMSGSKSASSSLVSSASATAANARVATSACGQLRTQTQGGWGSEPNGNNPGSYLHANFYSAFGELTIGCAPSSYYIKLTSPQAITNLLPAGGKAAALTANATDPASVKSVLVGQLVALKLSVGFDEFDPGFGKSSVKLGSMIIGSGVFKGYTVYEFLSIAEQVLGSCSSEFTPIQVNETASSINENFVDGSTDKGFLICPDGENPPAGGGGGGYIPS